MAANPPFLRIPVSLPSWQEVNRRVSEMSGDVYARLEAVEAALGISPPTVQHAWRSTSDFGDWTPEGPDQWVGDQDEHPRGVAVGAPTGDPDNPGIEGVLIELTGSSNGGGGVALVGYRDEPTRDATTDPGLLANAPVEIAGQPVVLSGPVFLETLERVEEDRYLLIGQGTTVADGRHFSPLILGPVYQPPTAPERATDANDYSIGPAATTIVTLGPLANAYPVDTASFIYEVRLSEEGGRRVDFDVEIWLDQGGGYSLVFTDEYALSGQAQNVYVSSPIRTTALAPGDMIQMRVSGIDDHPQSDGWVRGSVRESVLEVRQG